jgi:fibronectin type 3 domain-containing protein
LRQLKPVIYQDAADGKRKDIAGRYVLDSKRGEVSFALAKYDHSRRLVIDPALLYSTFLGGSIDDVGDAIAVDGSGNAYVAGATSSPDFPVVNPFQNAFAGGPTHDAFVAKLNASGSGLIYSTYIGGGAEDRAFGIAIDGAGNAYIAGATDSTDFPTVNPLQAANAGNGDAFVAKISPGGDLLIYSTYLGGSTSDQADAIAVDGAGNAYVGGITFSPDFPTRNPLQATNKADGELTNGANAFLSKVDPDGGSLEYSTYLGGRQDDSIGRGAPNLPLTLGPFAVIAAIALDDSGDAYIAGGTNQGDFPTANALQSAYAGGNMDAFAAKVNPSGSALLYSTFLGGNGDESANAIAVDSDGNAVLAGRTDSNNFPTAHALKDTNAGGFDAFVTKLNADGSRLIYSTYLGGGGDDRALGVAIDSAGEATVAGQTDSIDFPTLDPVQAELGGQMDVFVAKLSAGGGALKYSTYLGGSDSEWASAVALDGLGNAYITGKTSSSNFPTLNPVQARYAGDGDAFVAKIGFPPPPAVSNLNASGGVASVFLYWSPASTATSYDVYMGGSGGQALLRAGVTDTRYVATGLTNGVTYYFSIVAVNAGGRSPKSNVVSAVPRPFTGPFTVTPAPADVTATAGNGEITVSWSPVKGAAFYNVYEGASPNGEASIPVRTGVFTPTSVVIGGLNNGTTYYFRVAAVNSAGIGPKSSEVHATPQVPTPPTPAAPTGVSAQPGIAQVTLNWTAAAKANTYNVYQGTTPGDEFPVPVEIGIVGTTATIGGLVNGTTYYFTVAGVNGAGSGPHSAEVSAAPGTPPQVTGLSAVAGDAQVQLRWNADAGAAGYTVYASTFSGGESPLATGLTATSYTATGLQNGTIYYFRVAGTNAVGSGAESAEVKAAPESPLGQVLGLSAAAGYEEVQLRWGPVSNASSYVIYLGTTPGGESPLISGVSGTSFTVTGLKNFTTYYFQVAAQGAGGATGPRSAQVSAAPPGRSD